MEENRNDDVVKNDDEVEKEIPKFRGLYRHVKISVKALDWIIVACIAVIVIVFLLNLNDLGFTVTFDSVGGTDVPAQTYMYGDRVTLPEPPTREGYTFTGWYKDYACSEPWNVETDTVEFDLTLYAGWEKTQ